MDELNIDLPFTIHADIGDGEQEFLVIPDWDEDLGESHYSIILDGIDLGVIRLVDIEEWEWIEGNMTKESASIFGDKIDSNNK
ncbi:hypothetical protein [Pedobacter sp. SYSU D00535]|uniref:hypothetical protein n=1 Tax=Pedobacter sp. SYSU D00535 TaxID=2810308 RepID=UPI001A977E90|nr:hypothetical protein [Pedobacter sp. SYSU D00535]